MSRACKPWTGLLTLWLLWPGPTAAQPAPTAESSPNDGDDLSALVDSVDRLLDSARAEARRKMSQKDYPAALRALRHAYELQPDDAETVLSLAQLYALLGNVERAEALYREALALTPQQPGPYRALAQLLWRDRASERDREARLQEAAELLARARELGGNEPEVLLLQARVAVARGRFEEAERAYAAYRAQQPLDDALRLELADFYRDFDQPERALELYRKVSEGEALRTAAQRIFDLEVEREARRYGLHARSPTATPEVRALVTRARARAAEGSYRDAEALLRRALSLAPVWAPAHAALGQLLHARGDLETAELSYLRALAIDHSHHEAHVGLGELYLARGDAQAAAQAALFFQRALTLRPDARELHLRLAQALRAAGDLPRALLHVERHLALSDPAGDHDEALELRALLRSTLGPLPQQPDTPSPGEGELGSALSRARALLSRGEVEAALRELRKLSARAPGGGHNREARMLEARILHAAGKHAEAASRLRELLSERFDDPQTHAHLARVLLSQGQAAGARKHLLEAERLGDLDSSYQLARLDAQGSAGLPGDALRVMALLHAKQRLQRVTAAAASAQRQQAQALLREVEARLWTLFLASLALLAALAGGVLWWRARRYGGGDLWTLLQRAPEAGPELSRILSAIAHEVLKHNTMMLGGLCAKLEASQDASDTARTLDRALFGADGNGGAAQRLTAYVDQLQQLGRAHGQRLNLRRRDAAIGALCDGFDELRALQPRLRRLGQLSRRSRARLLGRLREASALLNQDADEALRALLDETRVLRVDAALLQQVFERTAREPALSSQRIEPLVIDAGAELPVELSLPRQAFDDIIGNLFRNALQASARSGSEPVRVGLHVQLEVDPITGLQHARFAIRDRAHHALSRAQLRAATIESGLGLTADLVNSYDGSLDVRGDEPGWSKAVLLTLPTATT